MEEKLQIDALASGYALIDGAGKSLKSYGKHFTPLESGANLLSLVKSEYRTEIWSSDAHASIGAVG